MGERQRYRALRDTLADAVRAPLRRLRRAFGNGTAGNASGPEFLWALKDVSLEIRQGEVLGIIGRNGAGKSTLLKILSRITTPTEGCAEIRGRVGALLEVGTGFHPELTGRDNIFLNGAVLGMTRSEIKRRFDEIVGFSECGRFLDTPVKHYSSGMYMRLAFAVAAHLQTEILLVDEVLAVGDAAFQKKCLGTMGDAARQGRTVLFVSHNLLAVDSLCTRAICLHEGKVVTEGPPGQVTSRYLKHWIPASTDVIYADIGSAPGNEMIRLRRACVRPLNGSPSDPITVRTPFVVEFEYWQSVPHAGLDLNVDVYNEHGIHLFNTVMYGEPPAPEGLLRSWFVVPGDFLNSGTHRIELGLYVGGFTVAFHSEDLLVFDIHDAPSSFRGPYHGPWAGAVRPGLQWRTERIRAAFAPATTIEEGFRT
jgi:lipopolysaccharide transport system ATP-binding protein